MTSETQEKWNEARASLEPSLHALLDQFAVDYRHAARMHTKYQGGPNAGILAELIRMGWRKSA